MSMAEAGQRIKEAEASKKLDKVSTSNHNLMVWREAIQAGKSALEASKPTPMIVRDDPARKEWYVEGGVCGFAWVSIKPATTSFARWLLTQPEAGKEYRGDIHVSKDSYYGGLCIWVHAGGQSMQRKEAYAHAMADVLRKYGISAGARSRMD